MKNVLTVVGARPQFIKAAMISRQMRNSNRLKEIIVHTGQHYDANMSEVFFQELGIPQPDFHLGISGGGHGEMTGKMMCELEPLFSRVQPDLVLVYGDTNSTLAAALVACKLHIPVAHVEGGLRNHDLSIPEEVNRVVTDRVSRLVFYPTDRALENLLAEGFEGFGCRLVRTGDLMYDAALCFRPPAGRPAQSYVLLTLHRASNTEPESLPEIVSALNEIACEGKLIFPVHPRTRGALSRQGLTLHPNIEQLEPVGYLEMLSLLDGCEKVITDSGGLQKEAYAYGKTGLVLMEHTPWEELVEEQYLRTTAIKQTAILENWRKVSGLKPSGRLLYGDGNSARMVIQALEEFLSSSL